MKQDERKVFGPAPSAWEDRRGTEWQNRGCSTSIDRKLGSRCTKQAAWKIARNSFDRGVVRYACSDCKAKKYGHLPVEALA